MGLPPTIAYLHPPIYYVRPAGLLRYWYWRGRIINALKKTRLDATIPGAS
jgi:hypothetical protein